MKRAPTLHTHGEVKGAKGVAILKVLSPSEFGDELWPLESCLMVDHVTASSVSLLSFNSSIEIKNLRNPEVIRPGDVIRIREGSSQISILYRRGSLSNSLFITEQCNSNCVMCSQPPRKIDDSWRLGELVKLLQLVDKSESQLGFTGGEPTLFGQAFGDLLRFARSQLPNTQLHVLSNGRLLRDPALTKGLVAAGGGVTQWAIPLYGDVAAIHDEVVDSVGGFEETIEGLGELALRRARVEIRIVLHAITVPRLRQLSSYIYRRLPFVEHVAFMGLEPMGYARSNRHRIWIDPIDYASEISDAVHHLHSRGMNVSIYNLPYCVLPKDLWPFARASISDWKNVADASCMKCSLTEDCAGFFASAGPEWRSRGIKPLTETDLFNEVA